MSATVTIHSFDKEFAEKKIISNDLLIGKLISIVKEKPKKFSLLYKYALENLYVGVGLKLSDEQLHQYASTALYAIKNHFLLAQHKGNPVKIKTLAGDEFQTEGIIESYKLDCLNWCNGFFLALMLRDEESLKTLSETPSSVFDQAELKSDVFYYNYVKFLKNLVNHTQNSGDLLVKTYEGTNPDVLKYQGAEYVLNHEVPQLDLWTSVLSTRSEEFNQRLENALNLHKMYWNRSNPLNPGGAPMSEQFDGYFSLPVTGIAALAKDRGFSINVSSGYMPDVFVNN